MLFVPRTKRDAYCETHRPEPWARAERHGAIGEAMRKRVLRRDGHLCQHCRRRGSIVDHIVPEAEGGLTLDENLEAICQECHDIKTAAEAARGRARGRVAREGA